MTPFVAADPPLVPTPDEGRSLLLRELARSEYHEDDVAGRLLAWLERVIARALDAASTAPPLTTFVAMLVGLLLVLVLVWLVSRTRSARVTPDRSGAAVPDRSVTADEWRARAETAFASGDHGTALVDGFRALAVRQVEGGRLDDSPGATAHEIAVALRDQHPGRGELLLEGARCFDLVLYGDRAAGAAQARSVLDLDDELAGVSS